MLDAWQAGVAAVDPATAVRRSVPGYVREASRIVVIAFGKAAPGMVAGLRAAVGRDPDDGVVVVPYGTEDASGLPVVAAGHPLPDAGSIAAGAAALRLASTAGPDDVVVALVSGGGSALLAAPTVPLAEVRRETQRLLLSGAEISELNRYRRSVSTIKGGGLASACRHARLVTLIISDVVGDAPEVIASGPTMGAHPRHDWRVVATGGLAAEAAAGALRRRGCSVTIATTTLEGEARTAARRAVRVRSAADVAVLTGETTVTVRGSGAGGRNQEAALAAAIEIAGSDRMFLAAGTDGIDGPTDAAGALVDGESVARGMAAGRNPVDDLEENDAHAFLRASGDLIITGPTGTNVGDLWIVVRQTPRLSRNSATVAS